ncbi:MAG: CdaR family protein [Bacteroidota bacterium]
MNIFNWTPPGNDPQFRSKATIFLLCLFFSAAAWLSIKLSREATSNFPLQLQVTNIPDDLLITHQSDSSFILSLRTTGMKNLTSGSLSRANVLTTDFSNLQQARGDNDNQYFFTASQAEIRFALLNDLQRTDVSAHPDTVFFTTSKAFRKKVPVLLRKEMDLRPGFKIYDFPILTPDSVVVTGPRQLQDSITFIETEVLQIKQADKPVLTRADLVNPWKEQQVSLSEQQTEVFITIEEFTEATVELPLTVDCPEITQNQAKGKLMLFPDKVTVYYLVALRNIRTITDDMFTVSVACPDTITSGRARLKPQVTQHPGLVEIIRTSPSEVEYVWIKN